MRRFYKEVYVDWNMARADQVVSPQFTSHDWPEHGPSGKSEGVQRLLRGHTVGGTGWARYEVDDLDCRRRQGRGPGGRLLGTHQGDFRGIAPSGRSITLKGIAIYRVEGGQLMERLGLYPTCMACSRKSAHLPDANGAGSLSGNFSAAYARHYPVANSTEERRDTARTTHTGRLHLPLGNMRRNLPLRKNLTILSKEI